MKENEEHRHLTEEKTLLPCPFCGGKARLGDSSFGWPHHVYCTECGAKVTSLKYAEEGENEAIEKWNACIYDRINVKEKLSEINGNHKELLVGLACCVQNGSTERCEPCPYRKFKNCHRFLMMDALGHIMIAESGKMLLDNMPDIRDIKIGDSYEFAHPKEEE